MVVGRGGVEVIIFALSKKLFRRFSARDLLLLSAVCGVARWGLMGWSTALLAADCDTNPALWHVYCFAIWPLCAISLRSEVRFVCSNVYSAGSMGGSIAIMTVFCRFSLYQHSGGGVFWIMALVALPAIFLSAQSGCRRVMIP